MVDQIAHALRPAPIQLVQRGWTAERIGDAVLGAGEFLAGQHERHTGGGEYDAGRQSVGAHQILARLVFGRIVRIGGDAAHGRAQLVPQCQVVVGGNVLDDLPHAGGLAQGATPAVFGMTDVVSVIGGRAGQVAGHPLVEHMAAHRVSGGVAERADARAQVGHAALVGQNRVGHQRGFAGRPRLAVHGDRSAARQLVERGTHGVHRVHVNQAHEVESEAVDMVFARPVDHGIDDILAHHRVFGGHVVGTGRAVGEGAVGAAAQRVAGNHTFEPVVGGEHVVVDHVHDHLDAGIMQRLDHLFAFADAYGAIIRIGAVRAFGNVVVERIVAPVEAVGGVGAWDRFVDGTVVVERHELHGGDAEPFEVGHAGGELAGTVHAGVRVGEGQIGAAMLFRNAAVFVVAEVADVGFPNHQVAAGDVRAAVLGPACRVGLVEVDDHAAPAVHAGRAGPRVGGAIDGAVRESDQIVVVGAVADAVAAHQPGAVRAWREVAGLRGFGGIFRCAGVEQAQGDAAGRGRPDAEGSAFGIRERTEVVILIDGIIGAGHRQFGWRPIVYRQRGDLLFHGGVPPFQCIRPPAGRRWREVSVGGS